MPLSRHVLAYAVDLASASRPNARDASDYIKHNVEWGAGPRASQCLVLGAKSLALMEGRPTPTCEHVRKVAMSVLRHRIIPSYNATGEGIGSGQIVQHLLDQVREADYK